MIHLQPAMLGYHAALKIVLCGAAKKKRKRKKEAPNILEPEKDAWFINADQLFFVGIVSIQKKGMQVFLYDEMQSRCGKKMQVQMRHLVKRKNKILHILSPSSFLPGREWLIPPAMTHRLKPPRSFCRSSLSLLTDNTPVIKSCCRQGGQMLPQNR